MGEFPSRQNNVFRISDKCMKIGKNKLYTSHFCEAAVKKVGEGGERNGGGGLCVQDDTGKTMLAEILMCGV